MGKCSCSAFLHAFKISQKGTCTNMRKRHTVTFLQETAEQGDDKLFVGDAFGLSEVRLHGPCRCSRVKAV